MKHEQRESTVLFLTVCSLTKSGGGDPHYDPSDAAASWVRPELGTRLLARREEVRRRVVEDSTLEWQGVPLADLEFNHGLAHGPDFGGRRSAAYRPAIDRYQGRFFQALGEGGRQMVREGRYEMLVVSGLYGLVRPAERVQLYSCPLSAEVAEAWNRDSVLTDVLCEYIDRFAVLRVFDLVAIDAYRRLIDWQRVRDAGTDVLHCFDAMAAGESALTPFGMVLGSDLLDRSEDELLALSPDSRIENMVFQSVARTPTGFPEESASILAARDESRLWQPQSVGDHVGMIVRGANPEVVPRPGPHGGPEWRFTTARAFQRDLWSQKQQFDRILGAIVEICRDPMTARGNTVKPLRNQFQGMWRYRLGDLRLIYEPDAEKTVVHFLGLKPRSDAYD